MRIQNHQRTATKAGTDTRKKAKRPPAPSTVVAAATQMSTNRAMSRTSIRPSRSTSPTSLRRLPAVAAQASPRLSFLPTAAAIVTWATMPVTRISPSDCSTVPRSSEPSAPTRPAASAPVNPSSPGSRDRLTDQVSTAVTTTAEPTVAIGLKRMIRNAASYMSPSWSGRSAIAPGLWAAPSIPGWGGYGPGYGAVYCGGYWGGYPGGAYPGCACGWGYGCAGYGWVGYGCAGYGWVGGGGCQPGG